jgi:Glycosyl hydrolase family 30 beta sandwich domain
MLLATRRDFFGFPRLLRLPLTQRLRDRVERMGYQERRDFEHLVALRHQLEPDARREGSSQHRTRSLCRLRHYRCSDQGKHGSGQYWTFPHYARAGQRGARRFDSRMNPKNISPVAFANADGTNAVVIGTPGTERRIRILTTGKMVAVTLPADSLMTISWR